MDPKALLYQECIRRLISERNFLLRRCDLSTPEFRQLRRITRQEKETERDHFERLSLNASYMRAVIARLGPNYHGYDARCIASISAFAESRLQKLYSDMDQENKVIDRELKRIVETINNENNGEDNKAPMPEVRQEE